METQITISVSPEELSQIIKEGLREVLIEAESKENTKAISYSIHGAAKILNRHHTTIKTLILNDKIKTIDGGRRITQQALNDYLKGKP